MSAKLEEHETQLTDGAAEDTIQDDDEDIEPEIETAADDEEERTTDDDTSENDVQQVAESTRTQNKSLAPGNALGRVAHLKSARDEEPYEFERCTVLVMLQLTPLREAQLPDARKVFISARTHSHPPYVTQAHWSALESRLPDEIKMLVQRVQQELPQRATERRAAEEAERQRQAQIQADLEKQRAERKDKANATKSGTPKRGKKIDLNAPPKLPHTDANSESQPRVAAVPVMPSEPELAPLSPPAVVTPPQKPQEPSPQMTLF